jgi:prevent-host-death family protein
MEKMVQVTAEEAQNHLADLIPKAVNGETVVITQDGKQRVQLVPVAQIGAPRQPGSAKGKVWIADDFDEPLADLKEISNGH